jgi:hypothetical protein
MSDDRKAPVFQWIAAVLIFLPILYVAAFGPAMCLNCALDDPPRWVQSWLYAPDPLDWFIEANKSARLYFLYHNMYLGWWGRLGEWWRGDENAPLYTMP